MTSSETRLESWKEISRYLNRDERTVQRWELERNLPVHRPPGSKRSGVFAYPSELDHWLAQTSDFDLPDSPSLTPPVTAHCLDADLLADERSSLNPNATGEPYHALESRQATGDRSRYVVFCSIAAMLSIVFAFLGYNAGRIRAVSRVTPVHRLTFERGVVHAARFRSDGRNIIYAAGWHGSPFGLYETTLDRPGSGTLLPPDIHDPEYELLAVSPNSRLAVLLDPQHYGGIQIGTLAIQDMYESSPEPISPNVSSADWSPDGATLVYSVLDSKEGFSIKAYSLELHKDRRIYPERIQFTDSFTNVRYSPNGQLLAFEHHLMDGQSYVVILNPSKGSIRTSIPYSNIDGLAWSPDGKEVWFTAAEKGDARSIRAIDTSSHERLVFSAPVNLKLQDISKAGDALVICEFAFSSLFVNRSQGQANATEVPFFDWSTLGDISNDGNKIVFEERSEAFPKPSLYVQDGGGLLPKPLGEASLPASISPDGKDILAVTNEPCPRVVIFFPNLSSQIITKPDVCVSSIAWLPDGRRFVFTGASREHRGRCFVQSRDGADARSFTAENTSCSVVSPDGGYALMSTGNEFYKAAIDKTEAPVKVSIPTQFVPIRWATTNLVVAIEKRNPLEIDTVEIASGRIVGKVPIKLPIGVEFISSLNVSTDSHIYAFSAFNRLSSLYLIKGLR
jgi:Tol biopolymer transport system component